MQAGLPEDEIRWQNIEELINVSSDYDKIKPPQGLKEFLKQGYKLNDFAVFYRTNAQSRALEEAFIRHHIPHKLVGAIRFYQRKEIKDLVSYLKFVDTNDPISLERIINVPGRGIGKITWGGTKNSQCYSFCCV